MRNLPSATVVIKGRPVAPRVVHFNTAPRILGRRDVAIVQHRRPDRTSVNKNTNPGRDAELTRFEFDWPASYNLGNESESKRWRDLGLLPALVCKVAWFVP
jgi:hypothetical protein